MSNSNIDKSPLSLTIFPDAFLRKKIKEVTKITPSHKSILTNMHQVMLESQGIGLAANQVSIDERLVVIDLTRRNLLQDSEQESEEEQEENEEEKAQTLESEGITFQNEVLFMINPKIIKTSKERQENDEGCLSLPGLRANITRPETVECSFLTPDGESKTITAKGLLSACIQHEIDHLDGILFVDRVSRLKKEFLLRRYKQQNVD